MHGAQMSSEPLSVLMASGPMPVDDAVRVGCSLAAAWTAPHGELWPSAVFVEDDGVRIVPPCDTERSRYGQYAAPERILGRSATPESDVFSIGAILFHALAGYPPFRGASASAVMLSACSESPRDLPLEVPGPLAAVVMRALARDPLARYPTPAALREALDAFRRHERWPGRQVLAADDDAPIRELYHQIFERVGVASDIVASGRDAIEAMRSRRYDVVLLDLNLPGLSGWEVLDFLRAHWEARPEKLFIVTGFTDQRMSEVERTLVSAVLYKPVAPDELRMLLTECLRGATPDLPAILKQTGHRSMPAA